MTDHEKQNNIGSSCLRYSMLRAPATTKKNSSPFGGLFFFIIVIENDPGQDFLPLLLSQNFFHYFHLYGIIYTKAEKAVARCREMLEP